MSKQIKKIGNGCKDVRTQLTQALKMKNIWTAIGIIAIVAGSLGIITTIAIFGSVEQPFEDRYDEGYADGLIDGDQTFQLNITIDDFYVMDNDTLEKNYSYYLHAFSVNGMRLREEEWNTSKELNGTEWMNYAQNNVYFLEQSVFEVLDSSLNNSISVDNCEFITRHLPTIIIADYELFINNNDTTDFYHDVTFSHLLWEFITFDIPWSNYPYKSINKTQNIDIKFLGCSYNFTSSTMDRLFIEFNGIEHEVT